jgi:oxygen-independent coproporphyrinogen-3 oxidase
MPGTPPEGNPAPADGRLPDTATAGLGDRPFGVYIHVPYCATRCGYCDFNTYTPTELTADVGAATFVDNLAREIMIARGVLGDADLTVGTVFLGGGTPTLLPADDLAQLLRVLSAEFPFAPDVEITTEANPESVDAGVLDKLAAAGFTRISFGMQSARRRVLAALDRVHTPGRVADVVRWAREAGFADVSLDLIYGGPAESDLDWLASLEAALALEPDHVSAYALTVEDGTRLAGKVRRGEVLPADDDQLADRYINAERVLAAAGLRWYEISNWASAPEHRCRHNLGYWTGADWWGFGPGAHSHVGGVRWWNVRHPATYAALVAERCSPAQAREELEEAARRIETIMLGIRLADGLALDELEEAGRGRIGSLVEDGLLDGHAVRNGRAVLTLRGRLLADRVAVDLVP